MHPLPVPIPRGPVFPRLPFALALALALALAGTARAAEPTETVPAAVPSSAPGSTPAPAAAPAPVPVPRPAPGAPRIVKVLPHYLDKEGRHSVNPSLFDRDAYQFELRRDPSLRSGMRFDVLWKSPPGRSAAYTVKLELRGSKAPEQAPVIVTARAFSRGGFSQWSRIPVLGRDYDALGELLAWRVSLWKDDQFLAEQTSFLW